jgi:hypothetical protein
MANSIIIRDAVKEQWLFEEGLNKPIDPKKLNSVGHSDAAKAAWNSFGGTTKGGVLLGPNNGDYFCEGFDAAMKMLKAADNG